MPSHNRGIASPPGKKIADIPDNPTITGVTIGGETATITFTAPTRGGIATTYTAEAHLDGVATGITASSLTSPITISGLSNLTTYTFDIKGTNAIGSGPRSAKTTAYTTLGAFTLLQTFTSSGTFTVPAGVSEIAAIVRGAGLAGSGAGGRGGSGVAFSGLVATPSETHSVVVGSTSSFGTVASAGETATCTVPGASLVNAAAGGGFGGGSGSAPSGNLVLNASGISNTYKAMSGGGGGGGSGRTSYYISDCNASGTYPGSGGGAGSTNGGNGGTGSGIYQSGSYVVATGGSAGTDGTGIGAGGGGGGGSASWYGCTGNSGGGHASGNGSPGIVEVYGR